MGLREWRERRGMTLRDLVSASSVSMQTLVNLEHGRSAPQSRTLRSLARAMGLSIEDAYDVIAPKPRTRRVGDENAGT